MPRNRGHSRLMTWSDSYLSSVPPLLQLFFIAVPFQPRHALSEFAECGYEPDRMSYSNCLLIALNSAENLALVAASTLTDGLVLNIAATV